jgi:hypothetical protein
LYSLSRQDDASSYQIGVILLVAITFLLALLVLLMVLIQPLAWSMEKDIPVIFTITSIKSVDELTGYLNYDSRVLLLHTGKGDIQNKNLKARFLKNGQLVSCSITTMNGHDFISTSHTGVQWMGGSGCSGATWSPGEQICIDFSDGTFHPGDRVQMDVIDKSTNEIVSRHVYIYK